VLPTAAKIEHDRLTVVHTPARQMPPVEVATEVAIATVDADAPRRELAEQLNDLTRPSDAASPPRQSAAFPLRSSVSVAALPQEIGVDPDEPPSFSGNRPPNYPLVAQQRGWEGTVLLRLAIDAEGLVTRVTIERSSGFPVLDAEAVSAVRTWRGSPARRAGRPVATDEVLPVRFRLR
jgi:protein TonB